AGGGAVRGRALAGVPPGAAAAVGAGGGGGGADGLRDVAGLLRDACAAGRCLAHDAGRDDCGAGSVAAELGLGVGRGLRAADGDAGALRGADPLLRGDALMLLTYHRLGGLGVALWAVTILVCLFLLVPIV